MIYAEDWPGKSNRRMVSDWPSELAKYKGRRFNKGKANEFIRYTGPIPFGATILTPVQFTALLRHRSRKDTRGENGDRIAQTVAIAMNEAPVKNAIFMRRKCPFCGKSIVERVGLVTKHYFDCKPPGRVRRTRGHRVWEISRE